MKKIYLLSLVITFTSFNALAACPRNALCEELEDSSYDCGEKKELKACDKFVDDFAKVIEKQSCKDTKSEPIIWSCSRKPGAMMIDLHYERLFGLKTERAQRLFTSQKFRESLDGHLAETFLKRSEEAEKKLKKGKKKGP